MSKWGFPAYGQKGRWTALIEPFHTRRIKFYLLSRTHTTDMEAIAHRGDDGVARLTPVKELSVTLQLKELTEGELPQFPTMESTWEDNDLRDFLQAIVDCAYDMGITSREGRNEGEIEALKKHLEDLRALQGLREKLIGPVYLPKR